MQKLPVGVDGGWTRVVAMEGCEVVGFESCLKVELRIWLCIDEESVVRREVQEDS